MIFSLFLFIFLSLVSCGVPTIPGSPWMSGGFPTVLTVSSPDFPSLNGAIGYLPMLNSAPVLSLTPVQYRLLLPNSKDQNYPGCNPYRFNTTDDGTPLAGAAILIQARTSCSNAQKVIMAKSLNPGLILLYDNQPSLTIANMPSVYLGDFANYYSYPVLSICQADGNRLAANLAFNKTGNSQSPVINFSVNGAGRANSATKTALAQLGANAVYTRTSVGFRHWTDLANTDLDPCWNPVFGLWCENGEIVHIDVYSAGWKSPFNAALAQLTSLAFFDVHVNNLQGDQIFHPSICSLPKLAYIRIELNPGLTSFPDCFDSLPLVAFVGYSNSLTSRITSAGLATQLVYFNVHGNPLSGPVFSSWNSPNIEILDLGTSNAIDSGGLTGNFPSLAGLSQLQKLDLSNNDLQGPAVGSPTDMFNNLPALTAISLKGNQFSMNLPLFLNCPALGSIDLSFNQFTGAIPTGWVSLTKLTSLTLSNNFLTGGSVAAGISNLQRLDLSYNSISLSPPYSAINNWCQLFPTYSSVSLVYLDLSHNQISGPAFQGSFTAKKNVQWIDFSYNLITSLPSDLFAHTNLSHFDISFNNLGPASMPAGGPTSTYVYLDFSSNPNFINPVGTAFPSWLTFSTTLTSKLNDRFSCRQLAPADSSLNPALSIKFDPDFFQYFGCSCQSGSYGKPPSCFTIPSSNTIASPILTPLVTPPLNYSETAIAPLSLSDSWYGNARALPGLDAAWTIDLSGSKILLNRATEPAGISFVEISSVVSLAPQQEIQTIRSIILDIYFDLNQFNEPSDALFIYSGGSNLKGERLDSFRGDQSRSLNLGIEIVPISLNFSSLLTLSSASQTAIGKFSKIGRARMQVKNLIVSINFQSRSPSNPHFHLVYSASNSCPDNFELTNFGVCSLVLPEYFVSENLKSGLYAASALVSAVVIVICLVFIIHRNSVLVRASSRLFTSFILLNLLFMSITASLYAIVPEIGESKICNARLWCSSLSLMSVLAVLVAKSFRVSVIFGSKILLQIRNVTDSYVAKMCLGLLLVEILMLGIFSGEEMSIGEYQILTVNGSDRRVRGCSSSNGFDAWMGVQISIFALVMIAGGVVAFRTRSVPSAFNESTHILLSLELLAIFMILIVPIDWVLLKDSPESSMTIQAGGQIIISMFLLLANFVPKLYYLYAKRGNDKSLLYQQQQQPGMSITNSSFQVSKGPSTANNSSIGSVSSGSGSKSEGSIEFEKSKNFV